MSNYNEIYPMNVNYNNVKDSGKREEFNTGSKRDTREGKGRFDLLSPIVLERDAKHLENGAKKYGERNFEKGQPLCRFFDSAVRHLYRYLEGHRDEDHLAAARWNIAALMFTEEMIRRGRLPKELNDLPNYLGNSPAYSGEVNPLARPYRYFLALPGKEDDGYVWVITPNGKTKAYHRGVRGHSSVYTPDDLCDTARFKEVLFSSAVEVYSGIPV